MFKFRYITVEVNTAMKVELHSLLTSFVLKTLIPCLHQVKLEGHSSCKQS